ncbi:PAS domain-containing protein [Fulvivirga sediminis]|uniref:PAS domain-containing protein n=1 Tax=Fulvivirga sediminis TaxID=2803949 RepID=A0A937F6F6_9BACT|nr:PAS domain-containing protein [Fulvivirga sediminis]MBL3654858.1 PAS domain-containing protein [Fulvivirga sediminis]
MFTDKSFSFIITMGVLSVVVLIGFFTFNYKYRTYNKEALSFLESMEDVEQKNTQLLISLSGNENSFTNADQAVKSMIEDISAVKKSESDYFEQSGAVQWERLLNQSNSLEELLVSLKSGLQVPAEKVLELCKANNAIIQKLQTKVKADLDGRTSDYYLWTSILFTAFTLVWGVAIFVLIRYNREHKNIYAEMTNINDKEHKRTKLFSEYVSSIAKGEFENLTEVDKEDKLSTSLIELKDQFKKNKEEEEKRSWVNVGLAEVNEVLRLNDDLTKLSNDLISYIIKYLDANQGCIFITEDAATDEYMEMKAMYAYGRKKFIEKRIGKGQGLAGQCWQEGQIIHLKEVPESYVNITSGLGEALPKSVLIAPLKLNGLTYGIIEIASFKSFEPYQIEFIEKITEVVASMVSNTKTNETTKKLLEETQYQTEKMRSQEEEMRQNLEELSATQEGMQRAMNEVEEKERFMNGIINSTQDAIFALNKDYELLNFNQAFVDFWRGANLEPKLGGNMYELARDAGIDFEHLRVQWDKALKGQYFNEIETNIVGGKETISDVSYNPLKNERGEVIGLSVFFKDVTEQELAKRNVEKLLVETQEQAEMMKAQEEEMLQNMEELSATQEEMQRLMDEANRKEKFVNDIINSTDDTILTLDNTYRLINYNKALANSYPQIELKAGMSIFDLIDEKDRDSHKAYYDRTFAGEKFEVTDSFILNGKEYFFHTTYNPIKDMDGNVTAVAVFGKDTTEKEVTRKETENLLEETQQQTEEMKAQEEELRQNMEELSATQDEMQRIMDEIQKNENYLKEVMNVIPDPLVTLDKNGTIILYNGPFEKILEQNGNKAEVGASFIDMQFNDDQKNNIREIISKVYKGETLDFTIEYNAKEADIHIYNLYSPIRGLEGEIVGVANYSRDVTELVMGRKKK